MSTLNRVYLYDGESENCGVDEFKRHRDRVKNVDLIGISKYREKYVELIGIQNAKKIFF